MVMRVGGVIQSVQVDAGYTTDVWDALLPRRRPGRALILGLGGGTIATLMLRRWVGVAIVGVEHDPAVVALARQEFGLASFEQSSALRIVTGDAFTFVRAAAQARHKGYDQPDAEHGDVEPVEDCGEPFDAICVDMYTAGRLAHGALAPRFLRDLAQLVTADGEITFNLWRSPYLEDQLRRLRRELTLRELTLVDENVIARCGPLG